MGTARRGARAAIVAVVIAGGAIALVGRSRAQTTTTAKLAWVRAPGAETCIDGATLEARVSARLGRDAFSSPTTLSIDGVVERQPKKWIARLWVRTIDGAPIGTREIESEAADCASLGDAVAFAVALAIDPERALASPSTSASTSVPAAASASITAPTVAKEKATKKEAPPVASVVHVVDERPSSLSAGAGAVLGIAPKLAPGVVAAFDPSLAARVRPVVAAAFFPEQRNDEGSLGVGLTFLSAGACVRAAGEPRTLSLDGCLSLLGGLTHAVVYGLTSADPGDRPWLGASAGLRFHLELFHPFALALGGDAIFPFIRRSFDATGPGQHQVYFHQPAVGILAFLVGEIRFG